MKKQLQPSIFPFLAIFSESSFFFFLAGTPFLRQSFYISVNKLLYFILPGESIRRHIKRSVNSLLIVVIDLLIN